MVTKNINIELLKSIPSKNEKFKTLMQMFSERIRSRQHTRYVRLKKVFDDKNEEFTLGDFNSFFELLQTAGVGSLQGQGKYRSFKWEWNLYSVACASLGLKDKKLGNSEGLTIRPQSKSRFNLPRVNPISNVMPTKNKTTDIAFSDMIKVRGNKGIEMIIMLENLNAANCEKVASLIKNLNHL